MSSPPPDKTIPPKATGKATKASGGGGTKKKTKAATTPGEKKKPTRKRKQPSKTSTAASTQAIYNDARAASADLALQRTQAAARRADPLWYRIEDVLPFGYEGKPLAPVTSNSMLNEQVQLVESALATNGLQRADVTPQAFACLLEQSRRYTQELVFDAQDYAEYANRSEVSRADLFLASEGRRDHHLEISTQLPKLNLIAQQINRRPLPPIPTQCYNGVLLPPKEHQLTARTFDIMSGALVAKKMVHPLPAAAQKANINDNDDNKSSPQSAAGAYGAARGRQIPVNLKPKESETQSPLTRTAGTAPGVPEAAAALSSSTGPDPVVASSAPTDAKPMDTTS